jgi:hypothetical protein
LERDQTGPKVFLADPFLTDPFLADRFLTESGADSLDSISFDYR